MPFFKKNDNFDVEIVFFYSAEQDEHQQVRLKIYFAA